MCSVFHHLVFFFLNNFEQFGFFASLPPLTDIEDAINEIDYVQSMLKSDGLKREQIH